MTGSRVPKPSRIDEALRAGAQRRAKAVRPQVRAADDPTPDRNALEHPRILFRVVRDPLLVAMSARWPRGRGR